ncbi:hypothetical protein GCM10010172_72110 [Paractinoplanes ferrugineus]|uniref:Uncharacterized protein n=1 Tax=Paractinoplanes ferrugineus TaxID=113564 RepID=A0A919J346_9ACTN|nr:hypothetical protein [Actinoplanes ferrugineus]GIE11634.1 hypothetical protein Afe05nite_34740 [Actinoplanes ferrugineus]
MRRVLIWMAVLVAGSVMIVMGVRFAILRLDDADKWGSVVAAMIALLGLPMTVYGLVLARRPADGTAARVEQAATFSGDARVRATSHGIAIGQVGGDVHVGRPGPSVGRNTGTSESADTGV